MPVTVEKIEDRADDASLNATKVAYTSDSGLSATVQSVGVDVYLNSMDLKISVKGDKAVANLQKALKERGLDATVTTSTNAEAKMLTVRDSDPATGMSTLVTTMGKLGDNPGGIRREVADQIIEMELAAARTPPSEWDLMKVSLMKGRNGFADKLKPSGTPPSFYIKADINYELSPVAYLEEQGSPAAHGNDPLTRMGLRSSAASKPLLSALQQEGIKADIIQIDNEGITHVNVEAPAHAISKALREKGFLLASFDTEIQNATVKARLASAEEHARLQKKTATQL